MGEKDTASNEACFDLGSHVCPGSAGVCTLFWKLDPCKWMQFCTAADWHVDGSRLLGVKSI
jgi:hypothetical protein